MDMKIHMPHNVYQKIMFWVMKADFEVSGMGNASFDPKTGLFSVHDACLIKQEGGAAHTDIDPAALAKAMYEMRDQPGQLSFWWHSHVDMSVFMSATDVATCKQLGSHGWCLAMVFNKKYQYKTALAYVKNEASPLFGNDIKTGVDYKEDLPMNVTVPVMDDAVMIALNQQFDANVTRKVYTPATTSSWRDRGYPPIAAPKTDFEKKHDTFYDRWRAEWDTGKTQLLYNEWIHLQYEIDEEGEISKNFVKKSKKKAESEAQKRKTLITSGGSNSVATAGSKRIGLVDTDRQGKLWKDDIPVAPQLPRGKPRLDEGAAARFDAQIIHDMEAKALGVTPERYNEMLETASMAELQEMDDKINAYFSEKYGCDRDGFIPCLP